MIPTPASSSRVPIALIAGKRGTSSISADLEGLLRAEGRRVGHASPAASAVAGKVLASTPVPSIPAARGRLPRRARARMFAVALAFGLGLSSRPIASAAERHDRGAVPIDREQLAAARQTRASALLD